jgi:hypothetical protein
MTSPSDSQNGLQRLMAASPLMSNVCAPEKLD